MRAPRLSVLPAGRESVGILPWVIAIMVFLVTLTVAGGVGLRSMASSLSSGLAHTVTVRINAVDARARVGQTHAAASYLRQMPEVESIEVLTEADLRTMLEPWLGPASTDPDLPVPAMIDVRLRADAGIGTAELAKRLHPVAATASVDDHRQWLGQVGGLARALEGVALGVIALVLVATLFIVTLATRSSLASHKETIEILHLIGAEDGTIAAEFQSKFFRHGLKGGMAGAAAGALTIAALAWAARGMIAGSVSAPSTPPLLLVILLLLLPLAIAGLTMLTARLTVTRALGAYL